MITNLLFFVYSYLYYAACFACIRNWLVKAASWLHALYLPERTLPPIPSHGDPIKCQEDQMTKFEIYFFGSFVCKDVREIHTQTMWETCMYRMYSMMIYIWTSHDYPTRRLAFVCPYRIPVDRQGVSGQCFTSPISNVSHTILHVYYYMFDTHVYYYMIGHSWWYLALPRWLLLLLEQLWIGNLLLHDKFVCKIVDEVQGGWKAGCRFMY